MRCAICDSIDADTKFCPLQPNSIKQYFLHWNKNTTAEHLKVIKKQITQKDLSVNSRLPSFKDYSNPDSEFWKTQNTKCLKHSTVFGLDHHIRFKGIFGQTIQTELAKPSGKRCFIQRPILEYVLEQNNIKKFKVKSKPKPKPSLKPLPKPLHKPLSSVTQPSSVTSSLDSGLLGQIKAKMDRRSDRFMISGQELHKFGVLKKPDTIKFYILHRKEGKQLDKGKVLEYLKLLLDVQTRYTKTKDQSYINFQVQVKREFVEYLLKFISDDGDGSGGTAERPEIVIEKILDNADDALKSTLKGHMDSHIMKSLSALPSSQLADPRLNLQLPSVPTSNPKMTKSTREPVAVSHRVGMKKDKKEKDKNRKERRKTKKRSVTKSLFSQLKRRTKKK